MAHSDISRQSQHMAVTKHVTYQPITLADMQSIVIPGHNAGRILPAMLQNRQRVINRLVNRTITYYANNAAHTRALCPAHFELRAGPICGQVIDKTARFNQFQSFRRNQYNPLGDGLTVGDQY